MEKEFEHTYRLFRLEFFKNMYLHLKNNKEANASSLLDAEIIYILNQPTISEFARFVNISLPNATYRIKKLIKLNFIEKIPETSDHREYNLKITNNFLKIYAKNGGYGDFILNKFKNKLENEEYQLVLKAIEIIRKNLKE